MPASNADADAATLFAVYFDDDADAIAAGQLSPAVILFIS